MGDTLPKFSEEDVLTTCRKCGYAPMSTENGRQHKLTYLAPSSRPNQPGLQNTIEITCGRCGGPVAIRPAMDSK